MLKQSLLSIIIVLNCLSIEASQRVIKVLLTDTTTDAAQKDVKNNAEHQGRFEPTEQMLRAVANAQGIEGVLALCAMQARSDDEREFWISQGISANCLFANALLNNNANCIKLGLKYGADPKKSTGLIACVLGKNTNDEAIDILLADPRIDLNEESLGMAISNENKSLVKKHLILEIVPHDDESFLRSLAAEKRNEEIEECLNKALRDDFSFITPEDRKKFAPICIAREDARQRLKTAKLAIPDMTTQERLCILESTARARNSRNIAHFVMRRQTGTLNVNLAHLRAVATKAKPKIHYLDHASAICHDPQAKAQ